MAPGSWQTLISIAEVRKRYCSAAWQPGIADEVVTTERSHDLKFDKGTIYIVYFHTHAHVHIEKMGNLSKSKLKLYICDNKLRSCAQFHLGQICTWVLICSTEFAPPTKEEQNRTRVLICTRVHFHKTPFIGPKYTPGANLHPGCIFAPGCILCI